MWRTCKEGKFYPSIMCMCGATSLIHVHEVHEIAEIVFSCVILYSVENAFLFSCIFLFMKSTVSLVTIISPVKALSAVQVRNFEGRNFS